MAKQDDHRLNKDGSAPTLNEETETGRSWAEKHGGVIFLIIVVSVVSFVVLYESCLN